MNPTRIVTYALGVLTAIAAALLWTKAPTLAQTLLTAAAGILGFATTHPADAANLKAANAAALNVATGAVPTEEIAPAVAVLPRILPKGPGVVALLVLAGSLLLGATAWAQDVPPVPQLGFKIGQWTTCQPATAGGVQINLKTGNWQRFVFAQGFGCTYRGWSQPVGVAAYIGYGVVEDAPNAYQGALLFSYADVVATGPGLQLFRDPADGSYVEQMTWSLVGNFNWGASVKYLHKVAAQQSADGFSLGRKVEQDFQRVAK